MIMKLHHDIFRLGLPELGVAEVYHKILAQYGREVENVNKVYSKQKTDPPLNNNYPPIAGKITWARILFKRINVPIWELQVCSQRKDSNVPKGIHPPINTLFFSTICIQKELKLSRKQSFSLSKDFAILDL